MALLPTAAPAALSERFLATVAALLITTGHVQVTDAAATLQVDASAVSTAVAQLAERLAAVGSRRSMTVSPSLAVLAHAAEAAGRIRALEAVSSLTTEAVMTLVIVGHLEEATRRDVDERRGADSTNVLAAAPRARSTVETPARRRRTTPAPSPGATLTPPRDERPRLTSQDPARGGDMTRSAALREDAYAMHGELMQLRHELHRHPEVGLQLPWTQETVIGALDGLGLEVATGTALTSVTAVLRGARPGPAVLLRGDMDALPVQEETGLDFTSEVDGAMHACGHDLHTAMLVGAARLLHAHRAELAGDVVFMFQPGEEGWDGAGHMLAEGVLDAAEARVSSAYGMHVMSAMSPRGQFTTRPGTLMAASDELRVTVRGSGGHGSAPHLARDPIVVAAQLVGDLQTLVTRRFDVFDPVVVTVGSFHAGTKRNIIPDEATFQATVRSFSPEARERIRAEAVRLCESVATGYGLEVDAQYLEEYPVTVNDPDHAAFAAGVAAEVFGDERYAPKVFPQSGSEDFSRVLEEVPGCYLFLGAAPVEDYATAPSNHSPRAQFSDEVLSDGVLLHAELAMRALDRDAAASGAAAG